MKFRSDEVGSMVEYIEDSYLWKKRLQVDPEIALAIVVAAAPDAKVSWSKDGAKDLSSPDKFMNKRAVIVGSGPWRGLQVVYRHDDNFYFGEVEEKA